MVALRVFIKRTLFLLLVVLALVGCGSAHSEVDPVSSDQLNQYLQENPELQTDDLDDEGEMIEPEKAG